MRRRDIEDGALYVQEREPAIPAPMRADAARLVARQPDADYLAAALGLELPTDDIPEEAA